MILSSKGKGTPGRTRSQMGSAMVCTPAYSWSVGVFGVRIATRGMEVQGEGGRPFTVRGYSKGRPPSPWLAMVRGEATARPHPTGFPGSTKRLLNVSNRATVRWRASRCYEFSTPTFRCLTQVFRAAGALCFHNELSESVWNHQDSTISLSVKQSQLASGNKGARELWQQQ
jgi:hypothetical protein